MDVKSSVYSPWLILGAPSPGALIILQYVTAIVAVISFADQDGVVVGVDGVVVVAPTVFGFLFPMFQPQPRSVFTTLGVMAAVKGTRRKMNDLWMA